MYNELLTFRILNDEAIAQELISVLKEHDIRYEVEDSENMFTPSFAPNPLFREIRIKLYSRDFEKARQVLEEYYKAQLGTVDPDHYLFSFSDEELLDIIRTPDEWGMFDYQLALKILRDRGKEIQPEEVQLLRAGRNRRLARPEPTTNWALILGYGFAVLGGLIGVVIGWHLAYSKKTLPDGQSVYRFNEKERDNGTYILIIACVVMVAVVVARLKQMD